MTASPNKIPSWGEIKERLDLNQPHPIQLQALPLVQVLIEPTGPAIGLAAPASDVSLSRPARGLRLQPQAQGFAALWVEDPSLLEPGWSFLAGLAASVIAGTPFIPSLERELEKWRDLVSRLSTTSLVAAIGVLGELAVLCAAMNTGRDSTCWIGRDGGPIDFRFGDVECEVKTTLATRHEHIINGLTQLQPTLDTRLVVTSLVIAAAADGAGSSVASLVDRAEGLGVGWHDLVKSLADNRDVHLGDQASQARYVLRRNPLLVDAFSIPAITPAVLETSWGSERSRIRDVSYRVDLEGLPSSFEQVVGDIAAKLVL